MNTTEKLESNLIETRKAYYSLQEENEKLKEAAKQANTFKDQDDILDLIDANKAIIRALGDKMGLLESMVAESVEKEKKEVHLDLHLRTITVTEKLLNEVADILNKQTTVEVFVTREWMKSRWFYMLNNCGTMLTPKQAMKWLQYGLQEAYGARELRVHYGSHRTELKVTEIPLD